MPETVVFTELSAQGSCFSNKSFVDIPYLLRLNSKFKHIKVKSKGTYLTRLGKDGKEISSFLLLIHDNSLGDSDLPLLYI